MNEDLPIACGTATPIGWVYDLRANMPSFGKTSGSKWELTAYPEDAGDILELVSLNFQCPLALVYEEVEFPAPSTLQEELAGTGNKNAIACL